MSKFTEQEVQEILAMKEKGVSNREIARTVLGKESSESTLRNFFKEFSDSSPEISESVSEMDDKLDVLCESEDYNISNLAKRLRNSQKVNNQLRMIHRKDVDSSEHFEQMLLGVKKACSQIKTKEIVTVPLKGTNSLKQEAVLEVLFSDLQIGKIGQYYDTKKALEALESYGKQIVSIVKERQDSLQFSKIVFASLGDIVEDHLKHGVQSATSTDSGLSEQMANAITGIWKYVLSPLASLGIPVEVVCIAGNHGSSQHKGMDMYKAGLYSYDYTIYKALEGYCEAVGYDHVKFDIPHGVFSHVDIFGRTAIYEHGYFNSAAEKSMEDQMKKRGQQIKKHVDYFRCGDMHHVCSYDCHKMVLNGAFFRS